MALNLRHFAFRGSKCYFQVHKLAELGHKIEGHYIKIRTLSDASRELAAPLARPRREIGFHTKEESLPYRVKR